MRYFKIYVDEKNIQPRFFNWHSLIRPGIWEQGQVYENLIRLYSPEVHFKRIVLFDKKTVVQLPITFPVCRASIV